MNADQIVRNAHAQYAEAIRQDEYRENRRLRAGYIAVMLGFILLGVLGLLLTPAQPGIGAEMPACQTEDSDNCYWNAELRGNGAGRSFYVQDGTVTYLP